MISSLDLTACCFQAAGYLILGESELLIVLHHVIPRFLDNKKMKARRSRFWKYLLFFRDFSPVNQESPWTPEQNLIASDY